MVEASNLLLSGCAPVIFVYTLESVITGPTLAAVHCHFSEGCRLHLAVFIRVLQARSCYLRTLHVPGQMIS